MFINPIPALRCCFCFCFLQMHQIMHARQQPPTTTATTSSLFWALSFATAFSPERVLSLTAIQSHKITLCFWLFITHLLAAGPRPQNQIPKASISPASARASLISLS